MPGFEIKIAPMGAVRMTQRGKWVKPNAKRYLEYKQIISLEANKHFDEPMLGPIKVEMIFGVKPPQKMPKGRKHPVVKPDLDNMIKGLMDALNKIAWNDDAQVIGIEARKMYAEEGEPYVIVWVAKA